MFLRHSENMTENEETVKYMGPEWAAEAEKRLRAELTPEKAKNITTSMCCIYKNCPDGKQRYYFIKTENGNLVEFAVSKNPQKLNSL